MAFQQAQLGLVCIRVQCPSLPAASRRILPIIAAAKAAAPPSRLAERHAQKEAQRVEKERLQKQGRPEGKAPKSRKADTGSKADRDRLRKQRRAAPTKVHPSPPGIKESPGSHLLHSVSLVCPLPRKCIKDVKQFVLKVTV